MKAESTVMPEQFKVEIFSGDSCLLTFCENITEVASDQNTGEEAGLIKYQYDEYRIKVRNRENLSASVENNYSTWLQVAKAEEVNILASEARKKRDTLLSKSDKYALPDYPIMDAQKAQVIVYRQALRDVPEQEGFPYNINWPVLVM